MKRLAMLIAIFSLLLVAPARAAESYDAFTTGATVHHGLFPIWEKNGGLYLEISPSQLDADFLETIAPGNGIGQGPVWWGDTDYEPTQILRFERRGDGIVMLWRNWYTYTGTRASTSLAVQSNFPDSVMGIGKIEAVNATNGDIIFDLSSLLGDNLDVKNLIDEGLKGGAYHLDASLSYVDSVKAFPANDVFTIAQTWATEDKHVIDTAPDARRIQIRVVYNFVEMPKTDYRERLMDDRIGLYDDIYMDFSTDQREVRQLPYISRWNFDPEDPSHPSKARHPMVIILTKTIPSEYKDAIRDACLDWNKAFAKIGILDAIQVQDQPEDSNWDADDVRYSPIRWLTETTPSFGATSQTLFNPLTGEEFRTGVILSAEIGRNARLTWKYLIDPVRYGRTTDPVPAQFIHDVIFSTVVHEMGHNLGMQHNFIGHEAYTAAQTQSEAFTREHGITSSVMEYAPLNLWPQPYHQGEYVQTTIGPYDYFAIKWGYASIPGANTPEDEVPTLRKWAENWSNPWVRYASDEDVDYASGHAADPRVEQGMLTNDPLSWCNVQMQMYRTQIAALNRHWPAAGNAFEEERTVFARMLRGYLRCASTPAHYLGGQYLSWSHEGDPNAALPIVPVDLGTERRAMAVLDSALFNPTALNVSPSILDRLRYSEWSGYSYTSWEGYGNLPLWAYNPPERHDYPFVEQVNTAQFLAIDYLFKPLVLQRIDDNALLSTVPTMSMADLFDWLHDGVFRNLRSHSIPLVARNLQAGYLKRLVALATAPAPGIPSDAQAVAQAALLRIVRDAAGALDVKHDAVTSAHLSELERIAKTGASTH